MQKRQNPKIRFACLISENTTSWLLANESIIAVSTGLKSMISRLIIKIL
jgi:hypothetical protein